MYLVMQQFQREMLTILQQSSYFFVYFFNSSLPFLLFSTSFIQLARRVKDHYKTMSLVLLKSSSY